MRRLATAATLGAAVLSAGCARPAVAPATSASAASRASTPDFRAPPVLRGAERDPVGGVRLDGLAAPGAHVLLQSPGGDRLESEAGADGVWSFVLPPADLPRAYALSATAADGRVLRAEGALAVTPAPTVAALLMRGGAASQPAVSAPGGAKLSLLVVDWDAAGGAAVSGFAPPGAPVRLWIDGADSGAGQADVSGRYGLLAVGAPLSAGRHRLEVRTPRAAVERDVSLDRPAPPESGPVRSSRVAQGWRIDWVPPGGGVQTALALDPAPPPSAAKAARS